jgi:hypothetical protein
MKQVYYLAATLVVASTIGPAVALANVCQAGKLICPTTMPIGGYCECTSHGVTKDGTVVESRGQHAHINGTAGGCGAHPNSPGCR